MIIFSHRGEPVAGVSLTLEDEPMGLEIRPDDDFYFSDADPATRTTVAPLLTATGVNGSGLLVGQTTVFGSVSYIGGLPPGCEWSSMSSGSFVIELEVVPIRAVVTADPTTECP